jgi:microcystin-dependent protein
MLGGLACGGDLPHFPKAVEQPLDQHLAVGQLGQLRLDDHVRVGEQGQVRPERRLNVPEILDEEVVGESDLVRAVGGEPVLPVGPEDGSQLTNLPGTVPSGAMMSYAGISEPSGWLFCDGRAINRVTYAALFAAIGTTYGPGDGSTTFNIPDLRGRVLAGKDNMGTMGSANRLTTAGSGVNGTVLGATGGAETITLVESEMPAHYHLDGYVNGTSTSSGSYGSTVAAATNDMDFAGTGTAHPNTSTVGGGQPHDNVQPTLVANTIIKT